jgi:hypothetical protein
MMILPSLSTAETPQQLHPKHQHQHQQQANNNKPRIRTTQPTQRGVVWYLVQYQYLVQYHVLVPGTVLLRNAQHWYRTLHVPLATVDRQTVATFVSTRLTARLAIGRMSRVAVFMWNRYSFTNLVCDC